MANVIEQIMRAERKNPDSPTSRNVGNSERARIKRKARKLAGRRERELQAVIDANQVTLDAEIGLGKRFEEVGLSWKEYLTNDPSKGRMVKQQWQNLLSEFTAAREYKRVRMLNWLANGLGLSEQNTDTLRQEANSGAFFRYPLYVYQQIRGGNRFSLASSLLIEVVGEMTLGRSEEERDKFRNDIIDTKNLRGLPSVSLTQTFSPIANWLADPSRSVPQSPRLG